MSQTLTKPILLDETGQAIKTALQNIDETESQDWLLSYEDVHSEMDDNVDRIADALESIRDILDTSEDYPKYISAYIPPGQETFCAYQRINLEHPANLTVSAFVGSDIKPSTTTRTVDITYECTYRLADGTDMLTPDNNILYISWVYGKTGTVFETTFEYNIYVPEFSNNSSLTADNFTKVLDAHYKGYINLHDYWSVGDELDIRIDAVDEYTLDETHSYASQASSYNTLVILNTGGKELSEAVEDKTECAFVIGLKYALFRYDNGHFINNSMAYHLTGDIEEDSTTTDGVAYTGNWRTSDIRKWLNNALMAKLYYKSPLSSDRNLYLSEIIKSFKVLSARRYDSENDPTIDTDKLALLSIAESQKNYRNSYIKFVPEEFNNLECFDYFLNGGTLQSINSTGTIVSCWTRSVGRYYSPYYSTTPNGKGAVSAQNGTSITYAGDSRTTRCICPIMVI